MVWTFAFCAWINLYWHMGQQKLALPFFFLADLNFISLPDQALIQLHLHAGRLPSLFSFPFCFLDKRY
jgi:hypothetical protein